MLDRVHPFGEPARPYLSRMLTFELARERWQLDAYRALRRQVFCVEQAMFPSPSQEWEAADERALPIVAVAHNAGNPDQVVGVVRVIALGGGSFQGGRLAVERDYRRQRAVGAGLIRKAVQTACALGCTRFLATVQTRNARYFRRFHFAPLHAVEVCGRPHVLMEADLHAYAQAAAAGAHEREAAA